MKKVLLISSVLLLLLTPALLLIDHVSKNVVIGIIFGIIFWGPAFSKDGILWWVCGLSLGVFSMFTTQVWGANSAILVVLSLGLSWTAAYSVRWGKRAMFLGAPLLALIAPADLPPVDAVASGLSLVAGALYGATILHFLKLPQEKMTPVNKKHAFLYAVLVSVVTAIFVVVIHYLDIPHGYWVPMTWILVRTPSLLETRKISWERMVGTVAGASIAVLMTVLIQNVYIIAAIAFVCTSTALVFKKSYTVYALFLTVSVVLLTGLGDEYHDIALQRVVLSLAGGSVAFLVAFFVSRYAERQLESKLKDA